VVTVIITKLYEEMGSSSVIMPLNSPSGSTPQWDVGRGLPYVATHVVNVVEEDSLHRDICRVYWPYIVKSFGVVNREASEDELALLMYLAQHFASAGKM